MKINNITNNKNTNFQGGHSSSEISTKIPDFISTIIDKSGKDYKVLEQNLENLCEKLATNTYKLKNYILMPTDAKLSEIIEQNALFYMEKKEGILEYFKKIEITPDNILHIFRAKNTDENLVKFSSKVATDRAKKDFYTNLKDLILAGKIDKEEILNEANWFMSKDGSQLFNLSPNINGYTTYSEREKVVENLFNKLFNPKT